ncbi:MAG: FHA domain-containing protein [Lentisphaeria bacterium]|nr:FHA domain-containing protein [Lentisphaeria bacterium]
MGDEIKLVVLSKAMRGSSFVLENENISIGNANADIVLDDPTISGQHAILRRDLDGSYEIMDQDSTNGTRVNGVAVTNQSIVTGDVVQCGSIEMLYSDSSVVSADDNCQTAFDISQTAGNLDLPADFGNMNPFAKSGAKSKGTIVFAIVIAVLLILVLVLGGMVISNFGG